MSVSYIPQEIYAVCTNQMSATPQKLIASRDKITVFHDGKPLLTKKDKNLEVQFSCKSPINTFATFLAFGIGLALALAVPIGFVVAGAIIGLIVSSIIIKNHQCTSPMKMGSWILPHSNVKFNGYEAITQMSMLSCNNGGVLKPFFSYSLACKASVEIRNNNYTEIGINVVVSFFLGLLLPKALTKAFKTEPGILNFLGTNLIGIGVTWGIQYAQKEYMRKDEELSDNIVYQNMNEIEDETNVDDPSDLNDIASLESFKDAVKQGKITSNNSYAQGQLNKFSNYTTNQLKNSAEFKQFLNEIDKNTYGKDLRESMLSNVRKLFGPNKLKPTSEAVKKGIAQNQIDIKRSFYGMLKKAGEGSLFFLPFVSTYFSENMRKYFAKEAFKDMNNGINVVSQNPL
ncbi:DUF4280 domain-containing protein [Capnocytophaga genosp. AHN8471]|jgi:hypothetical protein|uniref:PAAR-like protein n=1 Tax=Capnocytophaga genosp. AHN8471 TaxID=327574 RepID=UPI001932A30B|nr:PAAR-like protein [Capnocytophaga genosp. AHN8471]MBM0654095.1 DUF4280 domain-containing protein [Capnocytophaga genosp. AHN8471]